MRVIGHVTIRTALLVGFGLTLGLWLFAGYQVTRRMTDEQRDAAAINARYIHAQELLSSVRAQVLLASVVVGDALLEPDSRVAPNPREVERIFESVESSLSQYVPVVDPQIEAERVARLREEIREYRGASQTVLSPESGHRTTDAPLLLRKLMPKREA